MTNVDFAHPESGAPLDIGLFVEVAAHGLKLAQDKHTTAMTKQLAHNGALVHELYVGRDQKHYRVPVAIVRIYDHEGAVEITLFHVYVFRRLIGGN